MTACKVCGNATNNPTYTVKEMQLGTREGFAYQHCSACGAMQLQEIPENLGKYYPNEDYYSFNLGLEVRKKPDALRKLKADYLLHGRNVLLGSLLSIGYKQPDYFDWVKIPQVQFNDAILDVGTGNGSLLLNLYKNGFTNLTGIDPFIDKDIDYGAIKILKKDIFNMQGQYDYIMLNHVFEHMDEPLKVLLQLKELLHAKKYILIRTPVMGMYGWQTYQENWVGLDAPRHIIIHSVKSMEILAEKAGLELKKVVFDSGPYHMWASEQYKKDVALMAPESYMLNKQTHLFSKADMQQYKAIAAKTNADKNADQAAYYLYKP